MDVKILRVEVKTAYVDIVRENIEKMPIIRVEEVK